MNAKLTALSLFAVSVFAAPAQAEEQTAWLVKQIALTDGNTTFDQTAIYFSFVTGMKSSVVKVAGPAQPAVTGAADSDGHVEAVPKRKSHQNYEPDFPISRP